jgi:hypothetical protein
LQDVISLAHKGANPNPQNGHNPIKNDYSNPNLSTKLEGNVATIF